MKVELLSDVYQGVHQILIDGVLTLEATDSALVMGPPDFACFNVATKVYRPLSVWDRFAKMAVDQGAVRGVTVRRQHAGGVVSPSMVSSLPLMGGTESVLPKKSPALNITVKAGEKPTTTRVAASDILAKLDEVMAGLRDSMADASTVWPYRPEVKYEPASSFRWDGFPIFQPRAFPSIPITGA